MLPDVVARPPRKVPGDVDRTLPLDVTDHLRHRVLRRDRQHEVHVIDHKVPFFHLAFAPLGQPAQLPHLSSTLRPDAVRAAPRKFSPPAFRYFGMNTT